MLFRSDLGYGKGYALVNNEFQRVLTKLAFLPYGLFLISHAKEMEVDSRTGKYMRVVPTLPDKARKIVLGMADMVLFCDLEVVTGDNGEQSMRRVIRTKPSLYYEAGDRTGRLPETLELDFGKFRESYNAATVAARHEWAQAQLDQGHGAFSMDDGYEAHADRATLLARLREREEEVERFKNTMTEWMESSERMLTGEVGGLRADLQRVEIGRASCWERV